MNVALSQMGAIIRNEFRMQWRRRTVLVILAALLLVPLLYTVTFAPSLDELSELGLSAASLTDEQRAQQQTSALMSFTWSLAYILVALALPVAVAETIPKDRQIGAAEVLGSLPMSNIVYLTGKLISVWVVALASLAIMIVLNALISWLVVGPFSFSVLLKMWLLGAVPLMLIQTGLAVLLAARQPTRRRAIFVGAALVIVCALMLVTGLTTVSAAPDQTISFLDSQNLGRATLFYYYSFGAEGGFLGPFLSQSVSIDSVTLTILSGFLQLTLVGAVVWLWMRWREQ